MRRLARELDTGPASLYVYIDNMADLHGAILDRLLSEVDLRPAAPACGWPDRLAELLVAYTEFLFAHPSLARSVLTPRPRPSGPNYMRLVDSVLVLLRTGGMPAGQAASGVGRGAPGCRLNADPLTGRLCGLGSGAEERSRNDCDAVGTALGGWPGCDDCRVQQAVA